MLTPDRVRDMSKSQRQNMRSLLQGRLQTVERGGRSATVVADGITVEETAEQIQEDLERLDRFDRLEAVAADPSRGEGPVQPRPATSEQRPDPTRDRALRALEAVHRRSEGAPDEAFAKAEALVTSSDPRTSRSAAQWVTVTADPDYERAFAKLCSDPQRGHLLWTTEEAGAYRAVEEYRAMSLTDAAGGFMVPFTLDPAIMLTSDGSMDPLRRIARVVQTTSDSWNGVSSAGVTAEWLAEAAEAADASPTLAQPSIPVHKGSAFVPFSFEVGMDALSFQSEVRRVMTDAAGQLQAEAYMNGSGSGQPTGFTVGLAAGSKVAAATADTLVAADVFGLQNALPPRFQARAQWASNLETANEIQQFETANGAKVFPEISTGSLLRKGWNEASFLDAAGDTATAGNDNVLAYGDWQAGFVIVDRIGSTVELIPNLFGANGRPAGQRGLFLWFRSGSDVVVDNAFRLLTA